MEPTSFVIERTTAETIDEATSMRLQSWLDTYTNEQLGVTHEWIEKRNNLQRSEAYRQRRLELLSNPKSQSWIAKDSNDKVIGMTAPYVDAQGSQQVGALYVEKSWQGKGVSGQLMQKVIDFFDSTKPIELTVVAYNERAKAFYRKWSFQEVPGSESLFDDKIPEIKMVRPAQTGKGVSH